MTKRYLLIVCAAMMLSACSGGQTTFHWQRENTGPQWFARDHSQCLAGADWWPWTMPSWPPATEPLPELRFDNDAENGIWATFQPYPGAQRVYVNSLTDDWSMSSWSYSRCMEKRGYEQIQPSTKNRQVFPE